MYPGAVITGLATVPALLQYKNASIQVEDASLYAYEGMPVARTTYTTVHIFMDSLSSPSVTAYLARAFTRKKSIRVEISFPSPHFVNAMSRDSSERCG